MRLYDEATNEILVAFDSPEEADFPSLAIVRPALADLKDGRAPTQRQVDAVRRMHFRGDVAELEFGECSAILSARAYAEGAIYDLVGTTDQYPNERLIEAWLVVVILTRPSLRDRVLSWNRRSFARGGYSTAPRPKRDEHFVEVKEAARQLIMFFQS
jgi:hypothetical protein